MNLVALAAFVPKTHPLLASQLCNLTNYRLFIVNFLFGFLGIGSWSKFIHSFFLSF